MKRGNRPDRKTKIAHLYLSTGGIIRSFINTQVGKRGNPSTCQAIVELLDGRLVTRHLVLTGVDNNWDMRWGLQTLRRGKQTLKVVFYSHVTEDKTYFVAARASYMTDNTGPRAQVTAFVEAWCAGNEKKCNDIIANFV